MLDFKTGLFSLSAILICTSTPPALAGEFNDLCAFGLMEGKTMKVSCVINETINQKTYCFGSQEARTEFLKNPVGNIQKASLNFLEINAQLEDDFDDYKPLIGNVRKNDDRAENQLQRRIDRNVVSPGARDDKELEWSQRRDY